MNTQTTIPRLLNRPRSAILALSDGSVFHGFAAGKPGRVSGEVVFNTSMTGYQEMLTDPSYHGQILCLTTSHVGQVGVNSADEESDRIWARALVVQDLDVAASSWRADEDLESYLEQRGVTIGWGFDVRAIVRRIRDSGAVPGVLVADGESTVETTLELARTARGTDGCDLAAEVACTDPYQWQHGVWHSPSHNEPDVAADLKVVVIDLGVKRSILRRLVSEGFAVEVLPPTSTAEDVLDREPAGVLLSNGPGDPFAVKQARQTAEQLIGAVPILGICLGFQILGLALGGRTVKLPFGHHGGNHPVRELSSGRVLITAQNHNYAVEETSLPREVDVTSVNLSDGTLEGLAHPRLGIEAVQFHPEASPGPNDATGLFERFKTNCRARLS